MDILRTVARGIRKLLPRSLERITICPFSIVTLRTVLINRSLLIPSLVSMMSRGLLAASEGEASFARASPEGSLAAGGCGMALPARRRPGLLLVVRVGSGFAVGSTGVAVMAVG